MARLDSQRSGEHRSTHWHWRTAAPTKFLSKRYRACGRSISRRERPALRWRTCWCVILTLRKRTTEVPSAPRRLRSGTESQGAAETEAESGRNATFDNPDVAMQHRW